MSAAQLTLIALALAMDAFAVSISSGIAIERMHIRHAFLIATFFGIFQGVMPFIGWHTGQGLKQILEAWDHWIAFALLVGVGAKMIYDACRIHVEERCFDPLNIYVLFLLSTATSIDALAVGFSLSLVDVAILVPVLVIGAVTFFMSFLGTYVGAAFGHILETKMEIAAGLLLIGIGVKILLESLLSGAPAI